MDRRSLCVQVGAIICFLGFLGNARAQTAAPAAALTLEELQTRLKHAQSETELDPTAKQEVIETYQAAIERLEIASEAATTAQKFQQRLESVGRDLDGARARLAAVPEKPSAAVPVEADIDVLERRLAEHRQQIDEPEHGVRARALTLKKELTARKSRLEQIAKDLAEIDERIASIQELADEPAAENEPREMTIAWQTLLQVRRKRANEERAALRAEQAWCESDDATELLRVERDLADRELAQAEAEAQALQSAVDRLRGSEADQRVRAARQDLARAPKRLKAIAEQNLALAVENRDLAVALQETNRNLDATRDALNALKIEFDQSQAMVDAVGLTDAIGLLLRQQRAKLGNAHSLQVRLALRSDAVRQTRLRMFQVEAEIATLQDLEAAATRSASELISDETSVPEPEMPARDAVAQLANEIHPMLAQRRDLLERLNEDHETQFQKLVLLDNSERKLLDATDRYARYIDERVLWIRTGTVFGKSQASRALDASRWLVDPGHWQAVVDAVQANAQRNPLTYAFALVAVLILAPLRWSSLRRLRRSASSDANTVPHRLASTLQAIALTLLLGAMLPAILGFAGWRLDRCASTSKFVHALGGGLLRAAVLAVPLEMLRMMVVRGGLAERHFEWSANSLARLRRHLAWFIPAAIVLIAVVGMIEATADEPRLDSLGRFCFLVFAALLGLFGTRAFPRRTAVEAVAEEPVPAGSASPDQPQVDPRRASACTAEVEDVWMQRMVRLGTLLAVAVPLGLLLLCWSGYFYTALQLTWRLQSTAWLILGLVLVRGTVQRWLKLERQRMAILQAEELQKIAGSGKHPGADSHLPFLFPRWTWPDFRLNLSQIVTQVRSLLDTGLLTLAVIGLWAIWADVTPALHILDRVTLWQTTVEEVEEVAAAAGTDGKPAVRMVQRPKAITAASVGMALLLLSIAVIAARNIPGLVEVILLEHLSVDAGIRFATTCLVRYAFFITGIVLAFQQIGIGWNSVQWLVAAASVGLGFGLQEIFANFVSGIILLFERPMRVGDVITIGDTTGTVSRIRFRATTIVDGDRKELVVPNKSFITGNLLNWTLSDSVNRVAIKVGVAYGTNPNRVRELLLRIAAEHPTLLKDPAPTATLEELGDSALVFHLRAFLPNLKDRQSATHQLNTMIHDRFQAAGIEIPFPQQDVHIRPSGAGEPNTGAPSSLDAFRRAGTTA